ncbi:low molecular weight phosphatase family protein [Microbacterium marinum]|uniref:arsenate reductase/protein-tyrosine-phosphatase family protein n=1 Tax=Microbacterium marinum TaxID=421115 RepID=UPI00384CB3CB
MFEIMTVCTGNVCRSPLAQQVLADRLADLPGTITSGGTFEMDASPMPDEGQRLAAAFGVRPEVSAAHRSRVITAERLSTPDLILAMARDHRRQIVSLSPARLRSTFTIREFARLAADTSDGEIISAASGAPTPSEKVRAAVATVAGHRGMTLPPESPDDDDVVDPYRRSWNTYERSGAQLAPAIDEVVRVLRLALTR